MNRKSTFGESLRHFIEGKGFYVVVLICVAAIGISGFYLLRSAGTEGGEARPVSGDVAVTVTPTPTQTPTPPVSSAPSAPSVSVTPDQPVPSSPSPAPSVTVSPEASPSPAASPEPVAGRPAALVYTWPVKGELLADFSLETLAYDETMGDWRTHSGIDIAAEPGSTVIATADGTVSRVFEDDLMGTTVVIDHGRGMVSTYANLQATPTVEEGDRVSTGSVIGAVGTTAIAESGRAGHLHFELAEDGMAVDPELYLPAQR